MTTPGASAPDGAYVLGDRYGQDVTEVSARNAMKAPMINPWSLAQDAFRSMFTKQYATLADHADGQTALNGRMDLLDASNGYGTAFMSHNWVVPHSRWCLLPFNTQLGPMKRVSVVQPQNNTGWLCLKAGGLWRVDALMCTQGTTSNLVSYQEWDPQSQQLVTRFRTDYSPVAPHYLIEVLNASGNLIHSKRFDALINVAVAAGQTWWVWPTYFPLSSHFSHTFVVDNMPDPESEGASAHWKYVRVSVYVEPVVIPGAIFTGVEANTQGGTSKSALTATRWSRDVANNLRADTVPDGGTLT